MKDPIEYFMPGKYYRNIPRTMTNNFTYDDLIASFNRRIFFPNFKWCQCHLTICQINIEDLSWPVNISNLQ